MRKPTPQQDMAFRLIRAASWATTGTHIEREATLRVASAVCTAIGLGNDDDSSLAWFKAGTRLGGQLEISMADQDRAQADIEDALAVLKAKVLS